MIRYCVYSLSQAGARKYRGCFVERVRRTDLSGHMDAHIWASRMQWKWAGEGFIRWEIDEERR